jgi:hypothetical protein
MERTTRSLAEILSILDCGDFDELIGTDEDSVVEAKGEPYQVGATDESTQNFAKQALAKDVSGLANAQGGVILIGFQTTRDVTAAGDYIQSCGPSTIRWSIPISM